MGRQALLAGVVFSAVPQPAGDTVFNPGGLLSLRTGAPQGFSPLLAFSVLLLLPPKQQRLCLRALASCRAVPQPCTLCSAAIPTALQEQELPLELQQGACVWALTV